MTAHPQAAGAPPALAVHNIQIVYGGAIEAVRDVSLEVRPGQIVALLGSNGAGKSTVLKAVSGVLDAEDGEIEKGSIHLFGEATEKASAPSIVRRGMVQVPEGRRLFGTLTVEENLVVGAHLQGRAELEAARDYVYSLFPRVADKRKQTAGYLSGGEQQMVAMGRALMSRPRLLLMDEPSMGLSPALVEQNFEIIQEVHADGVAILMVEQNANMALSIADRGYVLQTGEIVLSGKASDLLASDDLRRAYLGTAAAR